MLRVREYGDSGPRVIVLHGGPGAAGHMAPVARGLAGSYRVIEPLQRGNGGERLTVARHVADLHEIINVYAQDCHPAMLGASWGAMLALAYAAAHPDSTGPVILVDCGTFDLGARAALQRTIAERMTDDIRARLKCADQLDQDQRLKASAEAMLPAGPKPFGPARPHRSGPSVFIGGAPGAATRARLALRLGLGTAQPRLLWARTRLMHRKTGAVI